MDGLIDGKLFIAGARVVRSETFAALNPATGADLAPLFAKAAGEDVDNACAAAAGAFAAFSGAAPAVRAAFLERIADHLEAARAAIVPRVMQETALPEARVNGELGRTTGQLRLFAAVLRDGSFAGVRIDPALPGRTPPRPDLRVRHLAVGPVAVFGASNFPLAFSVAGGDTASAFAAGCPVVCKGHPAHPGTSELVAKAIYAALQDTGLPAGVFSLLNGTDNSLGAAIVTDPRIMAVGFTGSRQGGMALLKLAQARPVPIPVFAEMSSINPVFLLPNALAARAEDLGKAFVASLTMGVGQFCTNPGLVLGLSGPDLDRFAASASAAVSAAAAAPMLTAGIARAYASGVEAISAVPGTVQAARGLPADAPGRAQAALHIVSGAAFLVRPALAHEVFGPSAVLVQCADVAEMLAVAQSLEGQLTATLQMDAADHALARSLIPLLEQKAGRIIANGWPTGVEVTHAMVHGGPWPATSDSRTTSVGSLAINRFLRPVSYQSIPDDLLPPDLQDANPYALPRLMDGAADHKAN